MVSSVFGVAIACDKEELADKSAYDFATSIFQGKVENLQYLDPPDKDQLEPKIIVTFSVSKAFKGEPGDQVILHTTHNKWSCNGYVFKAGNEYLVYTKQNKKIGGFLSKFFGEQPTRTGVKVYAGTKPIENAKTDLAYFESNASQ